jgi:hypothetical protein
MADKTTRMSGNHVKLTNIGTMSGTDVYALTTTLDGGSVDNPFPVTSGEAQSSATQTRPAGTTAYSIGDVVGTIPATNMTFNNIAQKSGSGFVIMGANLEVRVADVPSGMAQFRLHLYNAAPTAISDNDAFNLVSADRDKYLGYIDMNTPVKLGDTLWSQNDNVNFKSKLTTTSTSLIGILETRGTYTPSASTVKKVHIKAVSI